MKVIDLLVKIANGKEVPKKIKYKNEVREYVYDDRDYVNSNSSEFYLFYNIMKEGKGSDFANALNDEVEIIEDTPKENKKIEKIKDYRIFKTMGLDCKYNERKEPKNYSLEEKEIVDKINEIIDKINGE